MSSVYFVAGTDTGVGKTLVCAALLTAARQVGLSTAAIKPVAAGGAVTGDGIRNEDAEILRQVATLELPYDRVNPVILQQAVAPHIAAASENKVLSAGEIARACKPVLDKQAQLTVLEGAGGWRVPLNDTETMADIARHLDLPVILVVGMRLGCLNHALLSAEAIAADGLKLVAWVANRIDPEMVAYQENLDTLKQGLSVPLLAEIPWLAEADIAAAASYFALDLLLSTQKSI